MRAIYSVPGTETEGWGGSVRRAATSWLLGAIVDLRQSVRIECGIPEGRQTHALRDVADQFGGLIRSASEAEITSSSGFAVQYPDNLSASARRFRRA